MEITCISVTEDFSFDVDEQVIQTWDGHANIELTFSNMGDRRIDNWFFTFYTPYAIENIWNASIIENDGAGNYTITNNVWNQDIEVASSVTVGMTLAAPAGEQIEILPDMFVLNTCERVVDNSLYSISYTEYSSYEDRFTGAITINALEDLTDWRLSADCNRELTTVSSAVLSSQGEGRVCLSCDPNNQNIYSNTSRNIDIQGFLTEEELSLENITIEETVLAYSLITDSDGNGISDFRDYITAVHEITPTPTETVTPTPTVTVTDIPSPTEEITPSVTDTPTPTNEVTITATPTETPLPTEEVVTVTPTTSVEPTPTEIDTTTDTDGDGLIDYLEEYFGTDKNESDSDDDGLNDLIEIMCGYDPLNPDTDQNGIVDADEDLDKDGLNNLYESTIGTGLDLKDSDGDGLNDAEEINVYDTDPTLYDTDSDGISDGDEVKLGKDPNENTDAADRIDQTLHVDLSRSEPSGITTIDISCSLSGNIDRRVHVTNTYGIDSYASGVRGRIGTPIDIECDEEISGATLVIHYVEEALGDTDENDLALLWIDSSTGMILLQDSEVDTEADTITVELEHFSSYMVVDKRAWLDTLGTARQASSTNMDFIFVINSSSDQTVRDRELQTIVDFMGHIRPGDRIGLVINDGSYSNDSVIDLGNSAEHMVNIRDEAAEYLSEEQDRDDYCYSFVCIDDMLTNGNSNSNTKVFILTDRTSDWLLIEDPDGNQINYARMDTTVVLMREDRNAEGSSVAADFGFRYFPYPMCDNLWNHIMGYQSGEATDSDGDGISDWDEINGVMGLDGNIYTSDPNNTDTDEDSIPDGEEVGDRLSFYLDSDGNYKIFRNGALVYDESNHELHDSEYTMLLKMVKGIHTIQQGKYLTLYMINSDPNSSDTDGDGYTDDVDLHPKTKDRVIYALGDLDMLDISSFFMDDIGYIHVTGPNGNSYYGGNQEWFDEISDWGCGIIASTDVSLYVNNGEANYSLSDYSAYIDRNLNHVHKNPFSGDQIPIVDPSVIKDILSSNDVQTSTILFSNRISDNVLERIISSIQNDDPVILLEADLFKGTGEAMSDLLNGLTNSLDYLAEGTVGLLSSNNNSSQENDNEQIEFESVLRMYKYNEDLQEVSLTSSKRMDWHYVTITGVYINNNTGKIYLKIQSWGDVYYINYSEFVDYNSHLWRFGLLLFTQQ